MQKWDKQRQNIFLPDPDNLMLFLDYKLLNLQIVLLKNLTNFIQKSNIS
jgi:hypothetical protein